MSDGLNGWVLADDVYDHIRRFNVYPSDAHAVAVTLWVLHSHFMDAFESTPRMAFLSPEPASGKTRALEVMETLVPNPVEAINVTPAYLFRKMGDPDILPTILFDEVDAVFGPKAKPNEEIRALINAGHRRGAMTGRCVVLGNKKVVTEEIPAYCAVAMAGLGGLPDTIITRSIVIPMRRRAPDEQVEPFRRRIHAPQGEELRLRLMEWAAAEVEALKSAEPPAMPDGIADRDADVWEPLLAVADLAGRDWPTRARVSAVTLVTLARSSTPSLGVRLLTDLKQVFGESDHLPTDSLLAALHGLPESPWIDLKGKPLDARSLARTLRKYGISPKVVRVGASTARGYDRADLHDAWKRYVPDSSVPPHGPVTSVTSVTTDSPDLWEH